MGLSVVLLGGLAAALLWPVGTALDPVRAPDRPPSQEKLLSTEPAEVLDMPPSPAPAPPPPQPAGATPTPRSLPQPAPPDAVEVVARTSTEDSLATSESPPGTVRGSTLGAADPLREASLLLPVAGLRPEDLVDTYTDARGEGRLHDAIDIMAPTGTAVRAVDDGQIVKLFDSKPGGLTIYQFDRERELAYYYAHLDRYAEGVSEGMQVRRGDLIGYVGYSGNANPAAPHLHFAIFILGPEQNWWQGTPINPYPHLGGR